MIINHHLQGLHLFLALLCLFSPSLILCEHTQSLKKKLSIHKEIVLLFIFDAGYKASSQKESLAVLKYLCIVPFCWYISPELVFLNVLTFYLKRPVIHGHSCFLCLYPSAWCPAD